MRRTLGLAGSFILNQRLVPDWWHPYYLEDAHAHATKVLSAAVRRDSDADAVNTSDARGVAGGMYERPSSSVHDSAQGRGGFDSDDDAGGGGVSRSHSLSLYEVNALVATFTSNHNVDELSGALQYVRERLQQPLAPYHYHALFRVFNYNLDRDNVVQLLEVMAQRGETTLETYARAADCIHCLAPSDSLARILAVVQAAQEAFGSLTSADVSGSEGATVSAYGSGAAQQAAKEEPDRLPGPSEAVDDDGTATSTTTSAPLLTSLLHHLAVSGSSGCDPVAVLLVALWIRALGVRLSDWDCVHVTASLLSRVEEFPRVRGLLGAFPDFPVGAVSPNAVLQRLEERGELSPALADSALGQVAAAMRSSLAAARVDMDAAVDSGLLNSRATSLRTMLQHALEHFDGSGPSTRGTGGGRAEGCGIGGHGHNPALLFHAVSLLQSSLRDHTESARVFLRAAEKAAARSHLRQERWQRAEEGEEVQVGALAREAEEEEEDAEKSMTEPFTVGPQYLMDIGSLVPLLSMRTREELRAVFTGLVQRMALSQQERQLQDTLAHSEGGADSTSAVVTRCAAAPPLLPSAEDLVGVEAYTLGFTRTYEEASAALQTAISRVDRAKARLPRETRLAFKQLAQYCSDHPLPNPKLTSTGLAERRKWGAYLDARDTALSLFGSSKQARESMKHLYYNDNKLAALRSEAVIAQDFEDTLNVFFPSVPPPSSSSGFPDSAAVSARSPTMDTFTAHRTSQPHIRCPASAVPRHLYDPDVFNVYPHIMLRTRPVGVEQLQEEAAALKGDLFAELWRTLMNPSIMGSDLWYLRNSDMYLLLMRCLLHRLDWEAAAHLTAKMLEHTTYTYLMDHELTTVFREIGDPAGCLAFKVATKLFDGRITRHGQTKRERFHQEQFQ